MPFATERPTSDRHSALRQLIELCKRPQSAGAQATVISIVGPAAYSEEEFRSDVAAAVRGAGVRRGRVREALSECFPPPSAGVSSLADYLLFLRMSLTARFALVPLPVQDSFFSLFPKSFVFSYERFFEVLLSQFSWYLSVSDPPSPTTTSLSYAHYSVPTTIVDFFAPLQVVTVKFVPIVLPLSPAELKGAKFARSFRPLEKLGPRFGRGLRLYRSVVPRFSAILETLAEVDVCDHNVLIDLFKTIGGKVKKTGTAPFGIPWYLLVNLENLGGFVPDHDTTGFASEVKGWVSGDIDHSFPLLDGSYDEEAYLSAFRLGIRRFLSEVPSLDRANAAALTIREWAADPRNWATPGSSDSGKRPQASQDGLAVHVVSNKNAAAAMLPPAHVARSISTFSEQRNRAIPKHEPAKVRAVAGSDDELYWKMAYVSHWLETALSGNSMSTLYNGNRGAASIYENMAMSTDTAAGWHLPLDQSHFDWMQNKRMIKIFCDEVAELVRTLATPRVRADLLATVALIERTLVSDEGTIIVGSEVFKVTKGVVSGWRWTALIDTAMNIGEYYAAMDLVRRSGYRGPEPDILVAQGDDDRLRCPTLELACAIVLAYKAMGFEVNPGKFFISKTRDEYLRKFAEAGIGTRGYAARSVNAVLWTKPTSDPLPVGIDRLSEITKNWSVLAGRLPNPELVRPLLMRDLCGASSLDSTAVKRLLATPSTLGGLGLDADWSKVREWQRVEGGQRVPASPIEFEGPFPGYSDSFAAAKSMYPRFQQSTEPVVRTFSVTGYKATALEYRIVPATGGANVPVSGRLQSRVAPSAAYAAHDVPKLLSRELLEQALAARDLDWIRSRWLDPSLRQVSDEIERRGGRGCWTGWLRGDWPVKAAVVLGSMASVTAVVSDLVQNAAMAVLLSRSSFTMAHVRGAFLAAEFTAREILFSRYSNLRE